MGNVLREILDQLKVIYFVNDCGIDDIAEGLDGLKKEADKRGIHGCVHLIKNLAHRERR